ncbi:MAG: TlpA disulfide reductase family protein [Fimbriimonadaceae bacterium]
MPVFACLLTLTLVRNDVTDRLKAIDALQEKPFDGQGDINKWVDDCYEVADKRGKLILSFYKAYPKHDRTTALIRTRWEDFVGHVRVPKLPRLDMIKADIHQFLKAKPLPEHRAVAREFECKEAMLRQWRLMLAKEFKASDPQAAPFIAKAKAACMGFRSEYPNVETGVYLFYQYSQLVADSAFEREAIKLIAEYYPAHSLGQGAAGRLRQLDALGKPFEFAFNDFTTGQKVDMKDLRGKVVLIDFWATWCGPCRFDIETVMLKMYDELKPRGFEIVGISGDAPGDDGKKMLADYIAQKKIAWPTFYDGKGPKAGIAQDWGISSWPTQFLVDKKGILRSIKADEGDRRKAIENLLAE